MVVMSDWSEHIPGFSGTYELKPYKWCKKKKRQLYEFTNDPQDPLTYHAHNGFLIRPDQHQITDMGSVPLLLQAFIPSWFSKDRWLAAFIYHDDAYQNHGWWFAVHGGWKFRQASRKTADKMLYQMVRVLGGSKANAWAIYAGVRIGGKKAWKNGGECATGPTAK